MEVSLGFWGVDKVLPSVHFVCVSVKIMAYTGWAHLGCFWPKTDCFIFNCLGNIKKLGIITLTH